LGSKGGGFIESDFGIQISGIRKEDYVKSNLAPSLSLSVGKKLNEIVSIKFGYSGFYFKTIANKDKRSYNYYNINFEHLFYDSKKGNESNSSFRLAFQLGGGLFENKYYDRFNFCGQLGLIGFQSISSNTQVVMRFNALLGWDLYQGDEDIINSIVIGLRQNL
jgi:hypothetical protein